MGDTKAITINGNVGNTNFSNLSINVYIIGFNHNSAREGNNRIHFKIGKIGGTQVALVDSQYGSGVSSSGYFSMNTSNTNSGGWANSHMRKTVLGSDASPTSPRANTLLAALPADLRAVMKPITKYSDNTGGGNNTASYVTSTTDYLFELAEFEYHAPGPTPTARSRTTSSSTPITRRATARSTISTTPPARRPVWPVGPSMRRTPPFSADSPAAAMPTPRTRPFPGAWRPALQPNPAEQSGKIPPTEVGGIPPHTNRKEGRRCLS